MATTSAESLDLQGMTPTEAAALGVREGDGSILGLRFTPKDLVFGAADAVAEWASDHRGHIKGVIYPLAGVVLARELAQTGVAHAQEGTPGVDPTKNPEAQLSSIAVWAAIGAPIVIGGWNAQRAWRFYSQEIQSIQGQLKQQAAFKGQIPELVRSEEGLREMYVRSMQGQRRQPTQEGLSEFLQTHLNNSGPLSAQTDQLMHELRGELWGARAQRFLETPKEFGEGVLTTAAIIGFFGFVVPNVSRSWKETQSPELRGFLTILSCGLGWGLWQQLKEMTRLNSPTGSGIAKKEEMAKALQAKGPEVWVSKAAAFLSGTIGGWFQSNSKEASAASQPKSQERKSASQPQGGGTTNRAGVGRRVPGTSRRVGQ